MRALACLPAFQFLINTDTELQPVNVYRIYVSRAVKPGDRWLVQYI